MAMMLNAKDLPEWKEAMKKRAPLQRLRGKTYEELNDKQKNELVKMMAVKLGLILPSD